MMKTKMLQVDCRIAEPACKRPSKVTAVESWDKSKVLLLNTLRQVLCT